MEMAQKKQPGYVKSENVIWMVVAALLIGFIGGVAFGIYKSEAMLGPRQSIPPAAMDESRLQAIDELKARVRQNPDDINAWVQLGHQYFDADRPRDAIEAYEKALAGDPRNADVWTDLGVMYRRSGDPQKAVEAFDRATRLDATHEISRFNKGIVLFHDLNDEKGALAAWESLLAINPEAKSPDGQTVKKLVDHLKADLRDKK
jgi:cytochrome c-type biogenesis protein CcmH/NrfG